MTVATTAPDPPASPTRARRDLLGVVLPMLIAYVPLLLTRPGQVGADTKTYLYLDPGKLLRDAPYIWDSQIGLGTVTHQNIGYLWPMGPWYWLFDVLGVPDWIAQRLWLGTVMVAAALGVRFLLRTLGWGGAGTDDIDGPARAGMLVASLAYMLSPYLLAYAARISVILLPWAALPWLIALTARALRRGGWRDPALFALVVLTVGGINATALILIGLGPLLWVVYAVFLERGVPWRRAVGPLLRIGALTLLTSLWWLAGLWAQGRYGLPVLRYTETYKTVADVSTAPEVLRGLGYWFFYGTDKLGPWIEPTVTYTENVPVLALSYLVPLLALASAAVVRWRYRAYFLVLIAVGTLVAVGSHPWDSPSPTGALFKEWTISGSGISMRSTPRAAPLVVLGMAVLLGAGITAVARRVPARTVPLTALATVLLVANLPALWTGDMVADNLQRPEDLPDYWLDAAAYLDERGDETRVLEVPGADFASYRWGNTVDPVTPGLISRGYVSRELFTWGSAPSANLLNAYDRRFHEGDMDPDAVTPIARVMAAGDLTLRSDLQYERYRVARPRQMWDLLTTAPGLGAPAVFGAGTPPNRAGPELPLLDEIELDTPPGLEDPPPVAVFPVEDPVPIVRTHAAERPLLVAGDGDGLVDAASLGLVDPIQAIFYSASYAGDPVGWTTVYDQGAELLVTDTNRRRARRWGTLRENNGYTEMAGEVPLTYDPGDQRLALFPGASDDAYTVAEQRGGATVRATGYGNPITLTPADRAVLALDGDPQTSWRVGAVDDPRGERLVIDLDDPVTTDQIRLLQPQNLTRNRWVTGVRLHFDDGPPVDAVLTEASRIEPGEVVPFEPRTFSHLELEITATDISPRPRYDGFSSVGFAEVDVDGVRVEELIRPPTDLLDRAGTSSLDRRLGLLFTRLRSNPREPVRTDEEIALRRIVDLPTDRSFAFDAQARLSALVPDDQVDRLIGVPSAAEGGVTATSTTRLDGALDRRALMVLDGDPTTAWNPVFNQQQGQGITVEVGSPVTFDHLDLELVTDGRHSAPTRLRVQADDGPAVTVDVPDVEDAPEPDATTPVRVDLSEALTGSRISVTVDDVRPTVTTDWYSRNPITMPVGIAELGIPGVTAPAVPATFDSGCRTDLLSVDGRPVPLRVTGTTADALAREPLTVMLCGDEADQVLTLTAGEHVLVSGVGRDLGIDLDRILLSSDAGGGPLTGTTREAEARPTGPTTEVRNVGRVTYDVDVRDADAPFWLAVGQSWNEGWRAEVDGRDLGPPQVIDGYGAGWLVDPGGDDEVSIHVEWTPQRIVWIALAISAVGVLACLGLVVVGRRRPDPGPDGGPEGFGHGDDPDRPLLTWPGTGADRPRSARTAALLAGAVAIFVALTTPVGIAVVVLPVVVGLATFAALRSLRGRGWLAVGAVVALGLAAAYVVRGQVTYDYDADFTWPLGFTRVHVLGLVTVFLLLGEAVRDLAVRRRRTPSTPHSML
jgi:arabinofuranan 3-O-arabinosyltransferase